MTPFQRGDHMSLAEPPIRGICATPFLIRQLAVAGKSHLPLSPRTGRARLHASGSGGCENVGCSPDDHLRLHLTRIHGRNSTAPTTEASDPDGMEDPLGSLPKGGLKTGTPKFALSARLPKVAHANPVQNTRVLAEAKREHFETRTYANMISRDKT